MDLKCKKLDCKYNKTFACTRKGIFVTDNCLCSDYEKAQELPPEQKQDVGEDMFIKEPKIHPYRHNKNICIQCNASCIFNHDKICKSNGITLMEYKKEPLCCTFMKK